MRFLRLAFVALVVLASDASALSATSKLQRLSARINAESQRQHALAETQIYAEKQDKSGNGLLTTGWVKVDDLVDTNQIRKKTTEGLVETAAQAETEQQPDENSPAVLLETERLMSQLSSLESALQQAKQQQQQRGSVLMETHEDDDEEDSMIERLSTQLSRLESALAKHQQQQQRGPVLIEQEPNNDIDVESMIGHIDDQLGSLERELEQHQGPPSGRAGDSTNDHRITDPFNDPLTHMESDLPEFELMEISQQQQQHDEEMMQRMESRVEALTRRLTQSERLTQSTSDDDDTELLEVSDARCPGYPSQYHYITKIGTTVINKCYDCSTYGYNWIWDGRTSCVHSGRFGW